MPELPEVETVCRGLASCLEGRRIERVDVRRSGMRIPFPKGLASVMQGRKVTRVTRKAKYILMYLDDGHVILAHLGMSGRMVISSEKVSPGRHDHIVLTTNEATTIMFNDPRRFGLLTFTTDQELAGHRLLRDLGPDPLDRGFTPEVLSQSLRGRSTNIKSALMDQKLIAGLGNIYVCESLHWAGISPRRRSLSVPGLRAKRLVPAIKKILHEAILAGGSTLRDHIQPSGELGYFQHQFHVYDREGEECLRDTCIAKGVRIKRIVQSGRSTFYCSECQR